MAERPTSPVSMRGQVAIVTGAGSPEGIGFAVAQRLHAAGLHVAIRSTTDRIHQRAKELDAKGERISSFVADLTDEAGAGELVGAVVGGNGRMDVLVNNACMGQSVMPGGEVTRQEGAEVD